MVSDGFHLVSQNGFMAVSHRPGNRWLVAGFWSCNRLAFGLDELLQLKPAVATSVVDLTGVDLVLDDLVHPLAGAVCRQRAFHPTTHRAETKTATAQHAPGALRIDAMLPFVLGKMDQVGHLRSSYVIVQAMVSLQVMLLQLISSRLYFANSTL